MMCLNAFFHCVVSVFHKRRNQLVEEEDDQQYIAQLEQYCNELEAERKETKSLENVTEDAIMFVDIARTQPFYYDPETHTYYTPETVKALFNQENPSHPYTREPIDLNSWIKVDHLTEWFEREVEERKSHCFSKWFYKWKAQCLTWKCHEQEIREKNVFDSQKKTIEDLRQQIDSLVEQVAIARVDHTAEKAQDVEVAHV